MESADYYIPLVVVCLGVAFILGIVTEDRLDAKRHVHALRAVYNQCEQDIDRVMADYLLQKEWSMGNGQCPECHGLSPAFVIKELERNRLVGESGADTLYPERGPAGHSDDCSLAIVE